MDAVAPPIVVIAAQQPERLEDWERRLLDKARVLHNGAKSGMLMVKFDGQVVTFWRVLPDGRGE